MTWDSQESTVAMSQAAAGTFPKIPRGAMGCARPIRDMEQAEEIATTPAPHPSLLNSNYYRDEKGVRMTPPTAIQETAASDDLVVEQVSDELLPEFALLVHVEY
ncbi:hypothetical protein [Nonomuraea sp. NPDC003201]